MLSLKLSAPVIGLFSAGLLAGETPSLICSFMTLEHLPDPGEFVASAHALLEPGGALDGIEEPEKGFVIRGGREMEAQGRQRPFAAALPPRATARPVAAL